MWWKINPKLVFIWLLFIGYISITGTIIPIPHTSATLDCFTALDTSCVIEQIGDQTPEDFTYLGLPRVSDLHMNCRNLNNIYFLAMMTYSNGNIFRVTGHSCGEFIRGATIHHVSWISAVQDTYRDTKKWIKIRSMTIYYTLLCLYIR